MEVWLYKVKRFLFHPFVFTVLAVDILAITGLWWYSVTNFTQSEQLLLVRYAVGVGVDFVGQPAILFVFPGLATVIMLGNAIIGYLFFEHARYTSFIITGISLLTTMYLGIALVLAVSLNI